MRGVNMAFLNFRDLRLKHEDLSGAILCGCNLSEVDMSGFILEHVNFCGANLERASLKGSKLRGSIFVDANLRCASLEDVDAPGVDFAGADMTKAKFDGANLENANFMPWLPTFVSSGDGSLRIAINHRVELKLGDATFRNACLNGALFALGTAAADTYWRVMAYRYLSTSKPRFDLTAPGRVKHSLLSIQQSLSMFLVDLKYQLASFRDEDAAGRTGSAGNAMAGLSFQGSSFKGTDFEHSSLTGCCFDGSDLRRAKLSGACLANASLKGAQLQVQKLVGVDLSGAILDEANLTNSDLTQVKKNTDLSASFKNTICIRTKFCRDTADMLARTKVAVLSKPPNCQFLDGSPIIRSRPVSAQPTGRDILGVTGRVKTSKAAIPLSARALSSALER